MEAWDIFDRIMQHEGGGVVHEVPGDSGGLTKWGVSQRNNPDVDVRNLTKNEAFKIFLHSYYFPAKADKLPGRLAYVHADAAFNHGVFRAISLLQSTADGELKVDGIFGPKTHRYFMDTAAEPLSIKALLYRRMEFYARIVAARPDQVKFLAGWANRLANINTELFG